MAKKTFPGVEKKNHAPFSANFAILAGTGKYQTEVKNKKCIQNNSLANQIRAKRPSKSQSLSINNGHGGI